MSIMDTKSTEHKKELHLILVGTSGSGRSATANTILGEKWFKACISDQSVTTNCQTETKTINGIEITVTDTPGLYCTRLSEEDVIKQLESLNLKRPYAYLLVISVGSFTSKEIETVSKLEEVLGNSFLSHTTIAFSHSDDLEFKTEKEFIEEGGKEFQDLIQKCSNRYHFFNNRSEMLASEKEKLINSIMKIAEENETNRQQLGQQNTTGHYDGRSEDFQDCKEEKRRRFEITQQCASESQGQDCSKIMALGLKGSGKTSSIKKIMKCYSYYQEDGCEVYTNETLKVKMFECPGFNNNQSEIEMSVNKGLRRCAPGPHVIMIVVNVDHLNSDTEKMMKCVLDILGPNARKHAVIFFTRHDDSEDKHIEEAMSDQFKMLENRFCILQDDRVLIDMFEILKTNGHFSREHGTITQNADLIDFGRTGEEMFQNAGMK